MADTEEARRDKWNPSPEVYLAYTEREVVLALGNISGKLYGDAGEIRQNCLHSNETITTALHILGKRG